jgi:hypothetical protein
MAKNFQLKALSEAALFRQIAFAAVLCVLLPLSVQAKDSLGIFGDWGAFRDPGNTRCYAIAQPDETSGGSPRPFASIGFWPGQGVRAQFHARLGSSATSAAIIIAGQRYPLAVGDNNAWAQDRRMDAALVAAMRSAPFMRVESRSKNGGLLADIYQLKGVASAIDAAALGCARR